MSSLNVERGLKKDHVLDAFAQGLLHNQKENNAQTTHLTGEREPGNEVDLSHRNELTRRCHFFVRFSDQRL